MRECDYASGNGVDSRSGPDRGYFCIVHAGVGLERYFQPDILVGGILRLFQETGT